MHDIMDECNRDGGEKSIVPQRLTFERLPPAKLEAKSAPDEMSMEMLMAECLREISIAHRGDSSTDEYCMELFRRATLQGDQEMWDIVQQDLRETVRGWIELHPNRTAAASLDSEENYIARAFAKLSKASACNRVRFNHFSDVLKYLQASLNGVILDSLRSYQARLREIAPPLASDTAESAAAQSGNSEIWAILSKLLPDVRERRMAYLLFHYGLGPKDIVHTFPEEFHDVREIVLL